MELTCRLAFSLVDYCVTDVTGGGPSVFPSFGTMMFVAGAAGVGTLAVV
jgi:hypothetical protein